MSLVNHDHDLIQLKTPQHFLGPSIQSGVCSYSALVPQAGGGVSFQMISPREKLILVGDNVPGFSRKTGGVDVLSCAPPCSYYLYSTKDSGCKQDNKVFVWLLLFCCFILSQVKDTLIALN